MTIGEFDILYRQLAPQLYRLAYLQLGDEEAARDCVQTVFASLWEQRADIDNATAYLRASLHNQIAMRYRALSVQERFARLYPIEIEGSDEAMPIDVETLREYVDTQLTEAVRAVVECVFYQRMSYRQTAEALGISQSTVNKHVVTALHKLRTRFAYKKLKI